MRILQCNNPNGEQDGTLFFIRGDRTIVLDDIAHPDLPKVMDATKILEPTWGVIRKTMNPYGQSGMDAIVRVYYGLVHPK